MSGLGSYESCQCLAKCLAGSKPRWINQLEGKADRLEWVNPASRVGEKAKEQVSRLGQLGQRDEARVGQRGVKSRLTRGRVSRKGWMADMFFPLLSS